MTSTETHKDSSDFAKPETSTTRVPADEDPSIGSLDLPGKNKTSDFGNGDSGASVSYDNNLASPAPSSVSPFPDNLNSPHTNPGDFDNPKSSLGASTRTYQPVMNSYDQRGDGRTSQSKDDRSISNLQKQLEWTKRNMDLLKQENALLEGALASSGMRRDPSQFNSNPAGPGLNLSNFKMEMASFKAELSRINSSLESCELGRKTFSEKWSNSIGSSLQQMNQSLNDLLVRNLDNPVDKVLFESLQSRLKSTEDRLKRSRMDSNDGISKAEERLLAENVDLKMSENEVRKKLQQSTNQIQAMRKNHQTLMEVFQRLKVRSSENGYIDLQEILKRIPVDDLDSKASEQRTTSTVSRDELQQVKDDTSKQISSLSSEKQRLTSELANANDRMELARKENDGLKKSLNELNSMWEGNMVEFRRNQASSIDRLLKEMEAFSTEARQLCRCDEVATGTIKVLEDVLDTKDRLLSSALTELEKIHSMQPTSAADAPAKVKQNSDQLTAIFDFMKFKASDAGGAPTSSQDMQPTITTSSQAELSRLNARCSKLEFDLEFAEKNLEFEKKEVESLQSQLNSCRDLLRQKTQQLDVSMSNESDLKRELKMNREWMDAVNKQLVELEKELQLRDLDKGSVQRLLEKDGASLERNEGNVGDNKYLKQALELDLMSSKNALDMSLKENLILKHSLEQSARDLAVERDVTSAATYDRLILQQEVYAAQEERDAVVKERDEMKRKNALLQLENQKLASSVHRGIDVQSETELQERVRLLTAELQDAKKKLEAKEKDSAFYQDTLKFVLKSNEETLANKSQ